MNFSLVRYLTKYNIYLLYFAGEKVTSTFFATIRKRRKHSSDRIYASGLPLPNGAMVRGCWLGICIFPNCVS